MCGTDGGEVVKDRCPAVRARRQLVEFHQIIAERLADNHRQGADGEAMVVEGGVEMSPVAHRHECGVGADGSCDDGDFLYGFIDRFWSCSARFADFVENGFDRLSQFVARLSSYGQLLASISSEGGLSCAGGACVEVSKPIV